MKKPAERKPNDQSPSELISARIAELGDWRGKTLARMRALIKAADPEVVEEWKWMGTPVWSHDGIICTGESYKNVVKLTFAKGASAEGSGEAVQLEPRWERPAGDRHPRRGRDRRAGVQGAGARGGFDQRQQEEKAGKGRGRVSSSRFSLARKWREEDHSPTSTRAIFPELHGA